MFYFLNFWGIDIFFGMITNLFEMFGCGCQQLSVGVALSSVHVSSTFNHVFKGPDIVQSLEQQDPYVLLLPYLMASH